MSEDLLKIQIASIIHRSRHHEESFLIDTKTAAKDILEYLKREQVLISDMPYVPTTVKKNLN